MCGRYALALRPAQVRQYLQDSHMPSQESIPDDDDVRQTYNFAPGYYGLVYRADVPDRGAQSQEELGEGREGNDIVATQSTVEGTQDTAVGSTQENQGFDLAQYKIQAMKWGLVPFWTKRNPDYGSLMRTINCRDDSLIANGGMWHTMKHKKRCVVIAQGFYEWLKKNGGKERIPHFVKRKDGQMMCFAGLWDCCKYEDSDEKLYTYTVITTCSNDQLGFLHDRMPVILNNGSSDMFTWLDANNTEWTSKLQSLLKPFNGELDCYPVSKDVGKVGNDSPKFVVPIDNAENKQNIANFFGNSQKKPSASSEGPSKSQDTNIQQEMQASGVKRDHEEASGSQENKEKEVTPGKAQKLTNGSSSSMPTSISSPSSESPNKPSPSTSNTTRSSTTNVPLPKPKQSPSKAAAGSKKITSFFGS